MNILEKKESARHDKNKYSQTNVGKIYSEPLVKKKVIHVHI
jgi:hypothetical protein